MAQTQNDKMHIRKINNMLSRGKINSVVNAATATAQIDLMHGETQNNMELPDNFGFISVPPVGSECIAAFFGGNRDHGTILKAFDKRSAPKTLQPGESMQYNAVTGTKVYLDKNGMVTISSAAGTFYMTMSASGILTFNLSEWWVNGYRLF